MTRKSSLALAFLVLACLTPAAFGQTRSFLRTDELLKTGEYLVSENRMFFLMMQNDGNLVLFFGSGPADNKGVAWASGSSAPGGLFFAVVQADGNFIIFKGTGWSDRSGHIYASGKGSGGAPSFAVLQDDGEFAQYLGTGPGDNRGKLWGTGKPQYSVTISPIPNDGRVTNDDQTLYCGYEPYNRASRCTLTFSAPTTITLYGDAKAGNIPGSWGGACTGAGRAWSCKLNVDGVKTVTRDFPVVGTNTFTITSPSNGTISNASGFTCPSTCTSTVSAGTRQTWSAEPNVGYAFGSWGGACAGQRNPCTLTADAPKTISVNFTNVGTWTVTISPTPTGGLIRDGTQHVSCGDGSNRCSTVLARGMPYVIYGYAAAGHTLGAWGGACLNQPAPVCTVTPTSDIIISKQFP